MKHPDFIYEAEKEMLYEKSLASCSVDASADGTTIESSNRETENARKEAFLSKSSHRLPRTKESVGAAITVAMVAVAVGFACCENLVYIFLYNGSSAANGE